MKELIQLTITFPVSETQIMILEKGSEAYKQMIDYAEINEGVTSEKPYLNEIDHSVISVALQHYIDDYESDINSPVREGDKEVIEQLKECVDRAKQALSKLVLAKVEGGEG